MFFQGNKTINHLKRLPLAELKTMRFLIYTNHPGHDNSTANTCLVEYACLFLAGSLDPCERRMYSVIALV